MTKAIPLITADGQQEKNKTEIEGVSNELFRKYEQAATAP
jgi:hypothetical protein